VWQHRLAIELNTIEERYNFILDHIPQEPLLALLEYSVIVKIGIHPLLSRCGFMAASVERDTVVRVDLKNIGRIQSY
jgi:hypothetical protein